MLVGPSQEKHVSSRNAVESSLNIRYGVFISMADVRPSVGVMNRSGKVTGLSCWILILEWNQQLRSYI